MPIRGKSKKNFLTQLDTQCIFSGSSGFAQKYPKNKYKNAYPMRWLISCFETSIFLCYVMFIV